MSRNRGCEGLIWRSRNKCFVSPLETNTFEKPGVANSLHVQLKSPTKKHQGKSSYHFRRKGKAKKATSLKAGACNKNRCNKVASYQFAILQSESQYVLKLIPWRNLSPSSTLNVIYTTLNLPLSPIT